MQPCVDVAPSMWQLVKAPFNTILCDNEFIYLLPIPQQNVTLTTIQQEIQAVGQMQRESCNI